MMNCLEFRREKLADPRRLSPGAVAHLNDCAACRLFAAEINENEGRLADVLAVPVPEGLAERIVLRRKTGTRFAPRLWAMAATVLVTLTFGFRQWKDFASQEYARLAIEHVMHGERCAEAFNFARIGNKRGCRAGDEGLGEEVVAVANVFERNEEIARFAGARVD